MKNPRYETPEMRALMRARSEHFRRMSPIVRAGEMLMKQGFGLRTVARTVAGLVADEFDQKAIDTQPGSDTI